MGYYPGCIDILTLASVSGGCPLLNTAVEADDAHPALRARARATMDDWYGMIHRIVSRGIERGELRAETDPNEVATVLISSLEGAIMMSKLYDDPAHVRRVAAYLSRYVDGTLRA